MNLFFTLTLLLVSVVGLSNAMAGGGWPTDYDGGRVVIDVNQIHNPSERYPWCDRYSRQDSTNPRDNNTNAYKACERGNLEARRMAERFGQGNGRVIGLLMGYVRGIFNAFEAVKNDSNYRSEGAAGLGDPSKFTAGTNEGRQKATDAAHSLATSDAVTRFHDAVKNHSEPNPTLNQDAIETQINAYRGIADGYSQSGLPRRSENELLTESLSKLKNLPSYHDVNSTTIEGLGNISFWNLFTKQGRANDFAELGWSNRDRAWDVWKTLPDVAKAEYDNLTEAYRMEWRETRTVDPATGRETITREQVKVVIYTADEIRGVWADGFKNSYGFYVSYYFSQSYNQSLADGYNAGIVLGEALGHLYATQQGKIEKYNELYLANSIKGYGEEYRSSYERKFLEVFQDYLNHPKIEFTGLKLIGKTEDGIYTPGEWIRAKVELVNYGGLGKNIGYDLVGDIEPGSCVSGQNTLARLSAASFETAFIGRISTKKGAREQANLGIRADGIVRWENLLINKIAEVESIEWVDLDPVNGNGTVRVCLSNPSKSQTPSSLNLRVDISLLVSPITMVIPPIAAETRCHAVTIPVNGIDPLKLIDAGQVSSTASINMDNEQLHTSSQGVSFSQPLALSHYFHALVNQQVGLSGTQAEIRAGQVKERFVRNIDREIQMHTGSGIWESNPQATQLGMIATTFKNRAWSSNIEVQNTARSSYSDLGQVLWAKRDRLDKGSARRGYSKLVMEFSPGIEKKKLKK